jgi:hypothetical protein
MNPRRFLRKVAFWNRSVAESFQIGHFGIDPSRNRSKWAILESIHRGIIPNGPFWNRSAAESFQMTHFEIEKSLDSSFQNRFFE